jgi:hypothetical protein
MITILTVDPGASGGLILRNSDGGVTACKMPPTEGDVVAFIQGASTAPGARVAYVEHVGGFTGDGQPGSAMFKFGRGVGVLIGALMAFGWRVIEVTPQKWQRHIGLGTRGALSKTEWKNKLKSEAQRRYPDQTVTLATADGLLIMEYAISEEARNDR